LICPWQASVIRIARQPAFSATSDFHLTSFTQPSTHEAQDGAATSDLSEILQSAIWRPAAILKGKTMKKKNANNLAKIGARLKLVRSRLRKTQTAMAKDLGISLSHYSKLEVGIGGMSRGLIYTFCRLYNISEAWLVYGEGEPPDIIQDNPASAREPVTETIKRLKNPSDDHAIIAKIITLSEDQDINRLAVDIAKTIDIPLNRAIALLISEKLRR
jgi:transcriptional regulator with XRE-family HTH domain